MKMSNSGMGVLLALAAGMGGETVMGRSYSRAPIGRSAKTDELQAELIAKAREKRDRRRARNLSNLAFTKRYAHQ